MPSTIDEFRAIVPLTTYGDYMPELTEQQEAKLPAGTAQWVRTSGYTGKYAVKWIPLTERFVEEFEKVCGGLVLLCMADYRGDVRKVKQHLKVLSTFASPPYASGVIASLLQQALNCDFLPSNASELNFVEKVKKGFAQALDEGLDGFGGLPSVLVTVGEQLKQQSNRLDKKELLKRRGALVRVLKGLVKSRLAGRPMLPSHRPLGLSWYISAISLRAETRSRKSSREVNAPPVFRSFKRFSRVSLRIFRICCSPSRTV